MRLLTLIFALLLSWQVSATECPAYLDYDLPRLHSNETVNLCEVAKAKVLLVVNTASHCGFTRQFEGLEALHQAYKDKNLMVVGFASNDFKQEAKTEAEAARVCRENFGVTFTMIAPSYVTGQRANPVFREINRQSEAPSWNFNKYLIDPSGKVIGHYGSRVEPDDETFNADIEALLQQ